MSTSPLYQQIMNDLQQKITSGQFKHGDQLPTEADISQQYNVSRITSKRALTELENKGFIYRVQGSGSFVKVQEIHKQNDNEGKKQENKEILMILPFTHNPGLGDYEKGINACLATTEYTLNIISNSIAGQRKLLEQAKERTHQGLLFYPVSSHEDLDILYEYHLRQSPVVVLDKCIDGIPFHTVVSDNWGGGYQAASHLIAQGHRRIAFFSPLAIKASYTIRERYFGYLKALHEHHLDSTEIQQLAIGSTTHSSSSSKEYCKQFITSMQEHGVTAVVAANDLNAIELMQTARSLGLQVPDDFSLIGFDNIQLSELIEPNLTTIAQDFTRIGYVAAESLLHKMREAEQPIKQLAPKQKQETISIPVTLIERQTVSPLPFHTNT